MAERYRKKGESVRSDYRTFKTTRGRKFRVKMTEQEIYERDLFRMMLIVVPFAMCWLFAWAAGML